MVLIDTPTVFAFAALVTSLSRLIWSIRRRP
jgi:hypothetical protein